MSAARKRNPPLLYDLDTDDPVPRKPYVALVPGDAVPRLPLDLPEGLRGQAREQVARRQLRDMLGPEVETSEVWPCQLNGQSDLWNGALIADRAVLERWRARAGKSCRAILPDYLSLPASKDLWVVQDKGAQVMVRLGLSDGFTAEPDMMLALLRIALADNPPKAIWLRGEGALDFATLFEMSDIPVVRSEAELDKLGLDRPKVFGHGEIALDLRTDPRAERERLRRRVLPWRWPVLTGLVAAGLWAGAQIYPTKVIQTETRNERAAALQTTQEIFVPTGPVLDVRAQVSRALAARRASAEAWRGRVSPLVLLGQAAPVIAASGARTQEVAYGPDRGLVVAIRLPDFAAVDALAEALAATGLETTVLDSRVREGETGVRAELQIGGAL